MVQLTLVLNPKVFTVHAVSLHDEIQGAQVASKIETSQNGDFLVSNPYLAEILKTSAWLACLEIPGDAIWLKFSEHLPASLFEPTCTTSYS